MPASPPWRQTFGRLQSLHLLRRLSLDGVHRLAERGGA